MEEETEQKKVTLEMLTQSLADLRYSVSEFQDSIEAYLTTIEETWRDVKSRLASIEARLAGMEVRLSALPIEDGTKLEELDGMLDDLKEIGADLTKMRQRFRSFAQGTLERVN